MIALRVRVTETDHVADLVEQDIPVGFAGAESLVEHGFGSEDNSRAGTSRDVV
jgi:hypothetical protein